MNYRTPFLLTTKKLTKSLFLHIPHLWSWNLWWGSISSKFSFHSRGFRGWKIWRAHLATPVISLQPACFREEPTRLSYSVTTYSDLRICYDITPVLEINDNNFPGLSPICLRDETRQLRGKTRWQPSLSPDIHPTVICKTKYYKSTCKLFDTEFYYIQINITAWRWFGTWLLCPTEVLNAHKTI